MFGLCYHQGQGLFFIGSPRQSGLDVYGSHQNTLSGRARNFTTREIKRCTLDLYKFKHCMRDQRPFDRVNGNLNLLVRSGVIGGVFTTDELMARSF